MIVPCHSITRVPLGTTKFFFYELVMTSMLRHPNGGVATLDAPSRIDRKKKVMMDARMDARMDDSPVDTAKSWEPHTHLQISINIYKYLPTSTDV